jgi:hypothetical protein
MVVEPPRTQLETLDYLKATGSLNKVRRLMPYARMWMPRAASRRRRRPLLRPAPVRVGGAVKAPKLISRISPEYPADALSSRVQGVVLLEATIGIDGKISDVRITRSIPAARQRCR